MKEIEVKAKLKNKLQVMNKLKALGCVFEEPVVQEDMVYAEHVNSLEEFLSNKMFLRIRVKDSLPAGQAGKKVLFTLKKKLLNDMDSLEHEIEISSKEEMEKILALLGYREALGIRKTRIVTHYDNCEICIDEVDDLGTFIEMEKLTIEGDSEKIQEELFKFFLSIGILPEDRLFSGYDILMWKKKQENKTL